MWQGGCTSKGKVTKVCDVVTHIFVRTHRPMPTHQSDLLAMYDLKSDLSSLSRSVLYQKGLLTLTSPPSASSACECEPRTDGPPKECPCASVVAVVPTRAQLVPDAESLVLEIRASYFFFSCSITQHTMRAFLSLHCTAQTELRRIGPLTLDRCCL